MSPLRGFAIHSKVEQTPVKPSFTQSREFLHDSRLAGPPLEKSAGLRLGSAAGFYWAYKRRPLAGPSATGRLDLINPKHLLNGYKLKADSI